MSSAFAVSFCGFLFGLVGIIAFVWALQHRQLVGSERAKFVVLDDETEQPMPAPAVSPRRARWLLAAIGLSFVPMAAIVLFLVVASARHPARAGARHPATSARAPQCPF